MQKTRCNETLGSTITILSLYRLRPSLTRHSWDDLFKVFADIYVRSYRDILGTYRCGFRNWSLGDCYSAYKSLGWVCGRLLDLLSAVDSTLYGGTWCMHRAFVWNGMCSVDSMGLVSSVQGREWLVSFQFVFLIFCVKALVDEIVSVTTLGLCTGLKPQAGAGTEMRVVLWVACWSPT